MCGVMSRKGFANNLVRFFSFPAPSYSRLLAPSLHRLGGGGFISGSKSHSPISLRSLRLGVRQIAPDKCIRGK